MCEVLDRAEKRGELRGEARLSALINKLIADGDTDAITKVTTDKQIRDAYYRKYEIA